MADETSLRAVEAALFLAIQTKDRAALERLLGPEFVLLSEGGARVERSAFIDAALSIPGEILRIGAEHLDARLYGEVGILSGVQRAEVRLEDGSVVVDRQVFTDVCLWRDGRWQVTFAHSVPAATGAEEPEQARKG